LDRTRAAAGDIQAESFNPSVGILLVWTHVLDDDVGIREKFQSLGRDSVGLDVYDEASDDRVEVFQSLGRDSVGLDKEKLDNV